MLRLKTKSHWQGGLFLFSHFGSILDLSRKMMNGVLNILRRILTACAVLFAVVPGVTSSQGLPRVTVRGTVVDDSTNVPLPLVNVFLANTTLGAATDKGGWFEIRGVPIGTHELVASIVGYEPYSSRLQVAERNNPRIQIRLVPKMLEMPAVEVVAADPIEWRRNYERFRELFIGNTPNATQCRLLNPEFLDFKRPQPDLFEATARQPLRIENRALGYRIEFLLVTFKADKDFLTLEGQPRYEELEPRNEEEKEMWKKNRERSYYGSLRHFLVSLVNGRLEDEGFIIYELPSLFLDDRYGVRSWIGGGRIVSPGMNPYEKSVHFKEFLEVEYQRGDVETGYQLLRKRGTDHQVSWITLMWEAITVDIEGRIRQSFPLKVYGYWAWKRLADALPQDYSPSESLYR